MLEMKDVTKTFGSFYALEHLSMTVPKGAVYGLVGPNGAGKSTFLKSLYCEAPIEEGYAKVLDFDLTTIKKRQIPYLRRCLGVVFQDFQLLMDRDVESNLEFVLKATGKRTNEEIKKRIEEVLRYVGMSNKGYRMPHELSGGEQQRIVIARALLNRPKILLADEPTGNLDPQTGEELMDLFTKIASEGTAVIMTTHNLKWTENIKGRIITCENGKLVENI